MIVAGFAGVFKPAVEFNLANSVRKEKLLT